MLNWCHSQPNSFVFVSRCAKYFVEELEWVFWCSCDATRGSLIGAAGSHIEMKYSVFQERFAPCLHITALKLILDDVDALHEVTPNDDFIGEQAKLTMVYVAKLVCMVVCTIIISFHKILDHIYALPTYPVSESISSVYEHDIKVHMEVMYHQHIRIDVYVYFM